MKTVDVLTNQIALRKDMIASKTNRIVMHRHGLLALMRRCVKCCCLDKSDRIGVETYNMFQCAALSSSDIFETTVSIAFYWSIAPNFSHQSFFVRKIKTAVP